MENQPNPSVSVVIIFLNGEPYIEEAIDSVFAQTESDWELLLVDDGSTDGSSEIARRRAAEAPDRVRYLEHPGHANLGMSASRNLGISEARGRYLAFLDADDIWLPERLEKHLKILDKHPEVGMVYGPTLFWYSWRDLPPGQRHLKDYSADLTLESGRPIPPPRALLRFLESGGGALPGICSLLVRLDLVRSVGGFEPDFRGVFEDQVFLSKVCMAAPVFVYGEVLDKYRQHPDSHCHQAIETGEYHPTHPNPARKRYLDWLAAYLDERGVKQGPLIEALAYELEPYQNNWRYTLRANPAFRFARQAMRRTLPPGTYGWLQSKLSAQLAAGRRS